MKFLFTTSLPNNLQAWRFLISVLWITWLSTLVQELPAKVPKETAVGTTTKTLFSPSTKEIPTTRTFFNQSITDPYAWLENPQSSEVSDWLNRQQKYTESILEQNPYRQAFQDQIRELSLTGGLLQNLEWASDYLFYLKSDHTSRPKLYYRAGPSGEEKLLLDPQTYDIPPTETVDGKAQILWFKPAPNGKRIAVGLARGANFDTTLYVFDVPHQQLVGAPVPGVIFFPTIHFINRPSWRMDSQALFFTRIQSNPSDLSNLAAQPVRLQTFMRVFSEEQFPIDDLLDVPIFGKSSQPELNITDGVIPGVFLSPISSYAIGFLQHSDTPALSLWVADGTALANGQPVWKQIATPDDQVVAFDLRGTWIYLLTYRRDSRLEIWRMHLQELRWKDAEIVVPASDQVIRQIKVAQDALYVERSDGAQSRLLRLIYNHRYNKAGKAAKAITAKSVHKKDVPASQVTKTTKKKSTKKTDAKPGKAAQAINRTKVTDATSLSPTIYWHTVASSASPSPLSSSSTTDGWLTVVNRPATNPTSKATPTKKSPTSAPKSKSVHNSTKKSKTGRSAHTSSRRTTPRQFSPPVAGRVAEQEIQLPFSGSIQELVADPVQPGVFLRLESWTEPSQYLKVNGKTGVTQPAFGVAATQRKQQNILLTRVQIKTPEGENLPLSILQLKDKTGNKRDNITPTILTAYGTYGASFSPYYSTARLAWLAKGGIYAICHVRGGGEQGIAWQAAGSATQKNQGSQDFLKCAEYLLEKRYTSPQHLGGWAQGTATLVVNNAVATKPELFRALVAVNGAYEPIRSLYSQTPTDHTDLANTSLWNNTWEKFWLNRELGSLNSLTAGSGEQFWLTISPYHKNFSTLSSALKSGKTVYPAVLLATDSGENSAPGHQPASTTYKMVARLQKQYHQTDQTTTDSALNTVPVLLYHPPDGVEERLGSLRCLPLFSVNFNEALLSDACASKALGDLYSFLWWQLQ